MEALQREFGVKMNLGPPTGDELGLDNYFGDVLTFVVIPHSGGGVCVCARVCIASIESVDSCRQVGNLTITLGRGCVRDVQHVRLGRGVK